MILIAGLGNPEKDYRNTRHNIGFEVLNKYAYDNNLNFNKAKFRSHIVEAHIGGQKIMLMKPQTYMNLSGEAIRDAMIFHKLELEDLIVVCDDTALDVGEIRIRKQGSSGGQNGLKNIIYQLDSDVFTRIRVGIGAKPSGYDMKDYVLSRFRQGETESMIEGVTKATDALDIIIRENVNAAMNKFNKKKHVEKEEPTEEAHE